MIQNDNFTQARCAGVNSTTKPNWIGRFGRKLQRYFGFHSARSDSSTALIRTASGFTALACTPSGGTRKTLPDRRSMAGAHALSRGPRPPNRSTIISRSVASYFAAFALVLCMGSAAYAADNSSKHFEIKAKPLADALMEFGVQSGLTVVAPTTVTAGKKAAAVRGDLAPTDALGRLLKGSGLTFARAADGTIAIQAISASGPVQASAVESGLDKDLTQNPTLEEVVVQGAAIKKLDLNTESATGSRLGLTALETPATIEEIGADTMRARGLVTVTEAANTMVGVNSGENPNQSQEFSMRGFTEDQIAALRDGLQFGSTSMTMRPQNTFNIERVEVLKGPASVLYGEYAVGGTINSITKKPILGAPSSYEFLATYGTYNSYQLGADAGGPLGSDAAYRLDVSRAASDGWVPRTSSFTDNVTGTVLRKVTRTIDVSMSLDYLRDELPDYWGQPLVPASFATQPISHAVETSDGLAIDQRMRYINYNVADHFAHSHQVIATATLRWKANDTVSVRDDVYHLNAKREWANAETYAFDPKTELVDRDRFFVFHDQTTIGNRVDATIDHKLGGHANRFIVLFDYNRNDIDRPIGFPNGDAVDPFNPKPGTFGSLVPAQVGTADLKSGSLSFEDVFNLSEQWRLVTGGRYERLELDRKDFDPNGVFIPSTSFERTFNPTSWRAGMTYEFAPGMVLYGLWSTAQDPVGAELFEVEANQNFDLAQSRQWEVGYKASISGGKAEVTFAYFNVLRRDFLTQINQTQVSNVGSLMSHGVEFASSIYLSRLWQASANVGYVDAHYGEFVNPDFGITASGNRPPNVARWTANVWIGVNQIGDLPLEVGGGVRFVGDRFGDYANQLTLKSYALVDAYAAYAMGKTRLTLRGRNLTDREYCPWLSPYYPHQVALGSPRTVEISVETKF